MTWRSGELITQEEWFADHVVTVRPVRVVEDTPPLLALYTAAGSIQVDGTMRDRSRLSIEERLKVYADNEPQPLRERPSRWHVLTLNEPGARHSFWVFWRPSWEHFGWFVNLQTPYQRTGRVVRHDSGKDSRGLGLLDLFVAPDLTWSWKDRDEFDAAFEQGMLTPEQRDAQLAEAHRMIERIEERGWPFNEPWPEWRPDPVWPVPHLTLAGARSWRLSEERLGP